MNKLGFFVFALTVVLALITVTLPGGARAVPDLEDAVNVAEALKMLERVDKFYSTMGRPR